MTRRQSVAQQTSYTILIIDDEPSIVTALTGLLRHHGYTVETASNGALAWEHLHAQHFDVILCDLLMPEIDGQGFYTMLQQDYPSMASRVIFLTGDTMGETSAAFLRQCGQLAVYKPCGAAEVMDAIEQVLAANNPVL